MKMDEAKVFWKEHFDGFVNRPLSLPYDVSPLEKLVRSGRGSTISLDLSSNVVDGIFTSMCANERTLFQLGLSTFYAFLFKLTEEMDLCVLTVSANRGRSELEDLIGFFVRVRVRVRVRVGEGVGVRVTSTRLFQATYEDRLEQGLVSPSSGKLRICSVSNKFSN